MNFDLSSLLIGIIAMDIIASIEVVIFAKIISKRMGWGRVKPIKANKRKPVVINNYYYSDSDY